jgi:hypothetical protein
MNMSNIKLFYDANLEVIGSQMPRNVKGSGDATMERKVEEIATIKEDHLKKKQDIILISK